VTDEIVKIQIKIVPGDLFGRWSYIQSLRLILEVTNALGEMSFDANRKYDYKLAFMMQKFNQKSILVALMKLRFY